MSAEAIRKVRSGKERDRFPVGTVLRWTSGGRYTYAAIKTEAGWFTTSRYGNTFVPQQPTWEELLSVLARNEVTSVQIASGWDDVPDSK